ncbi:MAG: hypothetical protein JSS83_12885 [Cyanobacteria bacterium SZAS LIN-3]|nr:hypothetical protein [Cyanobacteria bacterium SZAS LIN-3]
MSEDRNIYADDDETEDVQSGQAGHAEHRILQDPINQPGALPLPLPVPVPAPEKPRRGRPPSASTAAGAAPKVTGGDAKPQENKVVKLLEKNPLGMTLPEMAGGPRQIKRIKTMRPLLAEAIRSGLVMPVSQRAGHTVYRLVKHIANR